MKKYDPDSFYDQKNNCTFVFYINDLYYAYNINKVIIYKNKKELGEIKYNQKIINEFGHNVTHSLIKYAINILENRKIGNAINGRISSDKEILTLWETPIGTSLYESLLSNKLIKNTSKVYIESEYKGDIYDVLYSELKDDSKISTDIMMKKAYEKFGIRDHYIDNFKNWMLFYD